MQLLYSYINKSKIFQLRLEIANFIFPISFRSFRHKSFQLSFSTTCIPAKQRNKTPFNRKRTGNREF